MDDYDAPSMRFGLDNDFEEVGCCVFVLRVVPLLILIGFPFSPERWQHVVMITLVLVKEVHAAKWGGMAGVVVFFVQSGFMIS
jgi:hypothetical protein